MEWDQRLIDGLNLAFNESQVCGLRFDRARAEVGLLVEVLALPEVGMVDAEPRRVTVFSGVSTAELTLRRDEQPSLRRVLPLESADEVESFFASLEQADAMYGWSFFDVADPSENWNVTPSLILQASAEDASHHTMHWFIECGRHGAGDAWERYFLQGVIRFSDLHIERADGRPVSLAEFVAGGRRWWDAFQSSGARPAATQTPRFRHQAPPWKSALASPPSCW